MYDGTSVSIVDFEANDELLFFVDITYMGDEYPSLRWTAVR
jgi:hypothetical protein